MLYLTTLWFFTGRGYYLSMFVDLWSSNIKVLQENGFLCIILWFKWIKYFNMRWRVLYLNLKFVKCSFCLISMLYELILDCLCTGILGLENHATCHLPDFPSLKLEYLCEAWLHPRMVLCFSFPSFTSVSVQ